MASLPRRELVTVEATDVSPPMMQAVSFSPGFGLTLRRLLLWLWAGILFFAWNLLDWLRGRRSIAFQAARLREIIEIIGGTYKKIGRFLAMRIDLLPWAYCVELSQIFDQMEPFPFDRAAERIEDAAGQPLAAVYERFDPEPIVSTSIACTYQAYLKSGEKVAVKVRRPEIGEVFIADFRALGWILDFLEFLSFLRPGSTQALRRDFQETIQDEMNFSLEARSQALFRQESKKSGKKFFDAPKIYFELCNQEVLTQSFTSGMWLWELIAAVEQNDQEALERAAQLNIDPKLVAKRLLWVNFWGLDEHLLFRADLHTDNVIVRENSKLTFIDFSSVGSLSQEMRQALQQTLHYAWKRDPLQMAISSMALLEPLPPLDTTQYTKKLEETYWQFIYALESKHIEWWERTSARLWLGFVGVARNYNITMNAHVLRLIRASLLYDTIAARLCPKIDHVNAYQKFSKYRAKKARQRFETSFGRQLESGLDERLYLQVEELADTGERLFRQLQRFLSTPTTKFNAVLDKPAYALFVFFRFWGHVAIVTGLTLGLSLFSRWINTGLVPGVVETLYQIFSSPWFQLIILFFLLINVRTLLFRLGDKEI